MRHTLTVAGCLALAALAASGCGDKAKASYDECVQAEGKWDFVKAREACEAAAKADPNSKSGKAAQAKLARLREQAEKALAEKAAETKPCKAGKWVTRCVWKGEPRPNLMEGETAAACNQQASQVQGIDMVCPACVCADDYKEEEKKE